MHFVKKTIKKKADIDISELNIVEYVKKSTVPAIFITSEEDTFVSHKHVEKLYDNYKGGEKWLKYVDGDHNARRKYKLLLEISSYFKKFFN